MTTDSFKSGRSTGQSPWWLNHGFFLYPDVVIAQGIYERFGHQSGVVGYVEQVSQASLQFITDWPGPSLAESIRRETRQ
jgi:hypothetical protein